jgi:hypothetical protein
MIEIKQHIPTFFDGFERKRARIACAEDLDSIDWIEAWRRDPGFRQFSVVRDSGPLTLMAEYHDGKFWVLAYLSEDLPNLPSWKKPE